MGRSLRRFVHPVLFSSSSRPSTSVFQFPWRRKPHWVSFERPGTTTSKKNRAEYDWIEGVERLEEYQPGGYHPIMVGDVLHGRYKIADKLGFGTYSTVWLARDAYLNRYVTLKASMADSIQHETKVLRALSVPHSSFSLVHPGRCLVPVFLDEFEVRGPNGKHICYTVAPTQCNLREVSFSRLFQLLEYYHIDSYRLLLMHIHKAMFMEPPSSFDELSIKQLYETFGEPETVPITRRDGEPLPHNAPAKAVVPLFLGKYAEKFSSSDAHPLLTDFGEAFCPASDIRLGKDCHTPIAFRAPEAKFESQIPLAYSSDIWSLATAIWEIIGMKAIFSTDLIDEDWIAAQHVDVLGPMPPEWWQLWEGRARFFDEDRYPTESYKENKWPPLEESFEIGVQK
ncbi:hypothetical protein N7517_009577 [Penicillium concentricum]|uniref:non-specific serine/threonine protein kinase n=1 Tax=Penicillium concentricum TaxID=293559 RepID=A0A9W9UZB3_9EURO|nr:uncharacterized protein N7517_009577 [Penicillium concentricum]KAJ5360386.1 hypothetical protein N7517_009577 [Penicillium concentricum]